MANPNNNKKLTDKQPAISRVLFIEAQSIALYSDNWEQGASLVCQMNKSAQKSKRKRQQFLSEMNYVDATAELAEEMLKWFQN